jgi:hypothetical protein
MGYEPEDYHLPASPPDVIAFREPKEVMPYRSEAPLILVLESFQTNL